MKNALILHGTDANARQNWLPWLEYQLKSLGYEVWTPNLPHADRPDIKRYNKYIFTHYYRTGTLASGWQFDKDTIIIGHSSGAVEILGLLDDPNFPKDIKIKASFLVGAFKGDLDWESLKGMKADFNFDVIKRHCSKFIFIHSDNDPYCPIEDTKDLCEQVNGKFIELPGQGHFTASLDLKYTKFPELLEIIKKET